jgi:hypothetical protein
LDDSRISVFVKGIPSHDAEVLQMCAAAAVRSCFDSRDCFFAAALSPTRFFFSLPHAPSRFRSSCRPHLRAASTQNRQDPLLINHLYQL